MPHIHIPPPDTVTARTAPGETGQSFPADPAIITVSPVLKEICSRIELIARSSAPVFITGESGTGKEVVARLIHHRSGRSSGREVAVNCAAFPKDVIDNELFGHEREAYTGATSKRSGCFELADGGTLFLDEIAEMHPQVQAKLLRAIEHRSFRRLGGHEDIHVDVRVIAATNRDVPAALASGSLRSDLYYRLSVVEFHLPPLRERRSDIALLADHFFGLFCDKYGKPLKRFDAESLGLLRDYNWPGNVRELRNIVERVVLVCPNDRVGSEYLPRELVRRASGGSISIPVGTTVAEAERLLVMKTLAHTGDNKAEAARILGLSRKALYDKLGRYGQRTENGGESRPGGDE